MISFIPLTSSAQPQNVNCSSPAHFTIPANTTVTISTLFPTLSGIGGRIFSLGNGATLVVDKSFAFGGCTFRCGTGASITVSGSSTLSAGSSVFAGCGQAWNGITIGSSAVLKMSSCLVQEAQTCLTFSTGHASSQNILRQSKLVGTTNCIVVGIGENTSVGFSQCWGNRLEGVGDPSRGIVLNTRATLNFGSGTGTRNTISNVITGIDCRPASNLTLNNTNIWGVPPVQFGTGAGILSRGNRVTVTKCTFNNNRAAGILLNSPNVSVSISYCGFNGGNQQFGISSTVVHSTPCRYTIAYDTFNLQQGSISAILLSRPPSGISDISSIAYNIINAAAANNCTYNSFIDVRGIAGAMAPFEITGNRIENAALCWFNFGNGLGGLNNGISYTGDGNSVATTKNRVTYSGVTLSNNTEYSNFGIGYFAMPGVHHTIVEDTVTATLNSANYTTNLNTTMNISPIQCGIHVHATPNIDRICLNVTDSTQRGFHFGNPMPTIFGENVMRRHVHGLLCAANNNIDDQNFRANIWSTQGSDYVSGGQGARHLAASAPFTFRVNPNIPGHIAPTFNPSNLFTPENSTILLGCTRDTIRAPFRIDSSIADGSYPSANPAAAWDLKRQLWANLIRYPSWAGSSSVLQGFHNATLGTSPQRFEQAFALLREAMAPTASIQSQWNNLQGQYAVLGAELTRIDSLLGLDTAQVNQTYAAQLEQKNQALAALGTTAAALSTQYWADRSSRLQQLQTYVDQLPGNEKYESAWKLLLNAAIRQYQGNTLTQSEQDALVAVANACPDEYGLAVVSAPAYMRIEDATPYLGREDFSTCLRSTDSAPAPASRLVLVPNPTSEQVQASLPGTGRGSWQLHSATAALLRSGEIAEGQETLLLQVGQLPQGLYFLSVRRGSYQETARFVVSK
jgi:hypothetical protein